MGSARSHHTVEKNAVFIVDDAQVQSCYKFFERFFFVFHLGVMPRVRSMLLFAIILIMYLVNKNICYAPKCGSTADNCHASNCAAGCGKK